MLDAIIRFSIKNRGLVIAFSIVLSILGVHLARLIPIDVFPDLTAPTVTVMTDAHGMAPEEVETLVTRQIEGAVNGAPGVRRVRSNSIFGLSTVWVEFAGETDIYMARQIVNEKLQLVIPALPRESVPMMGAISSIMGEIMTIGLRSDRHSLMELKEFASFILRKRLLAISGVSQVVIVGGETRQYQILVDQNKLSALDVSLMEVVDAAGKMNENFSAGIMKTSGQDYLIRGIGRIKSVADIESSVVVNRNGIPVLMKDVASIGIGLAFRIGDTSVNASPAVLLSVMKHPESNTMALTGNLDRHLAELQTILPPGMIIDNQIFRQATFIQRAVDNVNRSIFEAAGLVILILFMFLGNFRTALISIVAMPVSLVLTIFVFWALGLNLNTMTLGGIAIAIGLIVDDAIIDVENTFRRLHENALKPESERKPALEINFLASTEIRSSIINATAIVIVVFVPLFFLGGLEGRLLKPLGISYIVSIAASLFVAMTLSPAMCGVLLCGNLKLCRDADESDSFVIRLLKTVYTPFLNLTLRFPWLVLFFGAVIVVATIVPLKSLGRSFLPAFNEGSLVTHVLAPPGTSLERASETASHVERILLKHPNVRKTARKTGRGDLDEHGKFANESEIEVSLDLQGKSQSTIIAELRASLALLPGAKIAFSQPISHRIDHMLSGTMANLAIKIYGPELFRLRSLGEQVHLRIRDVPGLVDLGVEQQIDVSQIRINPNRHELAKYGLTVTDLAHIAENALEGTTVSKTLDGEKEFDIVVKLPGEMRQSVEGIKGLLVDTPIGVKVPLSSLAEIVSGKGPYMINRENAQRKIVVQANIAGRDLRSVYEDVKTRISQNIKVPEGYFIEYGGQFESEAEATRTISLLSIVSLMLIFCFLYMEFGSYKDSIMVMVNLPLALIGGVIAIYLTTRIVDVSSLVGFITLFGIATRNGILLVSHYRYLMQIEGKNLKEAVFQGSRERLRPILMTALSSFLALVPFALAADQPGNEILSPLAIVISGGLITSTALNMVMLPALYVIFGESLSGKTE